ncbi:MAG: putative lipid II flippase MurJ [Pseudohongiella sp.]|nr:MAG: putative lipid II flippase MurJ [Pseudohongiella sp.]
MSDPHSASEQRPSDSSDEDSSLLRASGVTGSMTGVSRVLGLARDVVIARVFGVSDGVDAFFVANKIPNFMRRLFAEGAFNQAFVPVLSEYRSTKSLPEVQQLINAVAGSLGGFLLLFTFVAVAAAPLLAVPIAYGFTDEPDKFALLVEMLRITFPYLFLISMTALCGSVLNSYSRFAVPAVTPALLNLSLISCSFFLVPYMRVPELALAWAVLIAGVAQLLFQLPFLARIQLMPKPTVGKYHEGVERIKKLMVPALFGVSVSQINLLFDTFIATLLVSGSVSWLYYSDRLMELPLGTFGIAIAIVVLPSLSRKHATSSMEDFAATLDWAFRIVVLIAIPAALALIFIAEPLLIALFHNDRFTEADVVSSAGSLKAYAIGLIAFMSIKIFAPGYFARQDTATPVRIGIVAMVSNMIMNLLFFLGGLAHVGLALATSLAAFLNAGLLLRGLVADGVFKFQRGWGVFLLRVVLANALMVYFLMSFSGDWQDWLGWGMTDKILQLTLLVVGGVCIYGAVLFAAGLRWRHIYR